MLELLLLHVIFPGHDGWSARASRIIAKELSFDMGPARYRTVEATRETAEDSGVSRGEGLRGLEPIRRSAARHGQHGRMVSGLTGAWSGAVVAAKGRSLSPVEDFHGP